MGDGGRDRLERRCIHVEGGRDREGSRHPGVYASFDTADTVALLTISDGTNTIEHHIQGSGVVPCDVRAGTNKTVAASLAAGGVGVVGHVQMVGMTIDE